MSAAFAARWIAAWNAHDLEAVLAHYADEVVLSSPAARRLTGDGCVRGMGPLRAYWKAALAARPALAFTLLQVLEGEACVTVLYANERGRRVAETMMFDAAGRVRRAVVCYEARP